MELRRFRDAAAFRERAMSFLVEREAANNLILGVTAGLASGSLRYDGEPYLAVVVSGGRVVAAAMRTAPYSLVLSTATPDAVSALVADARESLPGLPGVNGPSDASLQFAEEYGALTGRPFARARSMRIYQIERVRPVDGVPGFLRRATLADRDLSLAWGRRFNEETTAANDARSDARVLAMLGDDRDQGLYFWVDGQPVAMCGHSGPTPHGTRVSYVYTPPELRGRGYASAATAALSQQLLDSGLRFCFLYTDLDNPVSNRIYQRIGYEPVVDAVECVFGPAGSRALP